MDNNTQKDGLSFNIFAVLGFITLLFVGLWATIQIVRFVPTLLSNLNLPTFGTPVLTITVPDTDIQSETPTKIAWEYRGGSIDDGALSFTYACRQGFRFEVVNSADTNNVIPCNAPYHIPVTDTEIIVIPVSESSRYIDVPLAINYTNTTKETIRGTALLTVVTNTQTTATKPITETSKITSTTPVIDYSYGKDNTVTEATKPVYNGKGGNDIPVTSKSTYQPTPKKTYYKTVRVPRTSNPNGTADLSATFISIGSINSTTNQYEAKGVVRPFERIAAKVQVTNLGDKETGPWTFTANLPTNPVFTYNSAVQESIMPGTRVELFITFDKINQTYGYGKVITFTADPANQIIERSEINNTASLTYTVANY